MKRIVIYIAFFVSLTSCEKVLFQEDEASKDPLENFDYLWEEVDRKYSYFELKNINWENIRDKYRPQLSASSTEVELFDVMGQMLNELRDDHTNLISPFNISRYNVSLQHLKNYYARTVEEHYILNAWWTGPFSHDFLSGGEVGYVRYGSFSSEFSDDQLSLILKRYEDTKGLILDLRDNGGGSIFNIPKILGRFVEEKTLVGYNITRNGPNHDDFSQPENFFITPYDGTKYTKPVIVLIDRGSYSATTSFALATLALDNITLMGDTTGGGGGLPNGGQLPNGWTYRFSISQLLDLDNKNYAEDGVPPQITVSFDSNDLTKDEILEAAILELAK